MLSSSFNILKRAFGTRVAVGISGGVDSAVAAFLLQKEGYDVTGVFMRNWDESEEKGNSNCSIEEDFREAQKVSSTLGIDLLEANFIDKYWDHVFTSFVDRIREGSTPNPDLDCNKFIKFSAFVDYASSKGFDKIATGHYARCVVNENNPDGSVVTNLLTGVDQDKDQSYFLASLDPDVLSKVLFPLGNMTKSQVRSIAKEQHLSPATRKSSTGICFIGRRNFGEFIEGYVEKLPGVFVDVDSMKILGVCPNILALTYGQGAGIGGQVHRNFVAGKDLARRIVYVCAGKDHRALYTSKAYISNIHWLSKAHQQAYQDLGTITCQYKARYRQKQAQCSVKKKSPDSETVEISKYWSLSGDQGWENVVQFEQPAFAITPQQFLVLYDGDVCIASAKIIYPCETLHETILEP